MVPVVPSIYSSSMVYPMQYSIRDIYLTILMKEYDRGWSMYFPLYILFLHGISLCSTAYRDIKKPTGHASHTNHLFGALGSISIKGVSSTVVFSIMSKRWADPVKYSPLISFKNWQIDNRKEEKNGHTSSQKKYLWKMLSITFYKITSIFFCSAFCQLL